MLTLIAIAAIISFMTLAITTLGIAILAIKNLVDAPESMKLQSAGFYKTAGAAGARCAA